MFKFLKYEASNGVATIAFNRPEVYNALNDELTFEIQGAIKTVAKDESVRVVVITGEGKAFCSGQDLKAAAEVENRSFSESIHKRYNPIIKGIRNLPKPVICRLNGVAAGAGCSLALACDIIIASEEAILVEAFISIGLVMDSGSSYFLPRLLGYTRAFELSTMATKMNGKQAAEIGLVNKAVAPDMLDDTIKQFTDYYANAPTLAIGMIKKMLNKSYNSNLEEVLEYEAYCQDIAGNSNDFKEGVNAFLEKRTPQFQGK